MPRPSKAAMIVYESAKFHPRFMIQLRGSVMPFACVVALPCALLATMLKLSTKMLLDEEVWASVGIDHNSHQVISAAFSGMNFLIGFLVVFRAQQAYSRFWEGCTAICTMQGEWFDAACSLIAFCKCSSALPRDVILFKHTLVRLTSLLNACVLMELSSGFDQNSNESLLKTKRAFELELIDAEGLDSQSLLSINSTSNKVQLIFTWIQQLIVESAHKQVFSVSAPILSRTFQELGNGMVSYRQANKIANIPLPFPYVQATEMLLVSHWLLIPFLMCVWVTSPIWTGILTFVQVAFFWSLNSIATELENPFGEDINDLPAQVMQKDFNEELLLLLRPSTGETAHLSQKVVLSETCDFIDPKKMSLGRTVSLSKKGVNSELPRHKRRSSLEGNTISLGAFQERINVLESRDGDFVSETPSESFRKTSIGSKGKERSPGLAPVVEASGLDRQRSLRLPSGEDLEAGVSSSPNDSEHPGGSEVIVTKSLKAARSLQFDEDEEIPAGLGHLPVKCEEKCVDPLQAAATRQLVADLACLPELVTVCEDLRDSLKALQPDIQGEQLGCLQELVRLAGDTADQGHAPRPAAATNPPATFGAFSASRYPADAETPYGRAAAPRATPKYVDGCGTLRSCAPQESQSQWGMTIRR